MVVVYSKAYSVIILNARESYPDKDRRLIRAVPYVVLASAILGIILAATGSKEIGSVLLRLCSPFVLGFAVLGVYSSVHRDRGLLDGKTAAAVLLLVPFAISVCLVLFTTYVMPELMDFLGRFALAGMNRIITIFVSVYSFTLVMVFTSHGVISTVVAYFRKYTARIYLSIEQIKNDDTDTARSRISRWVYDIPSIIDIERIELEPAADDDRFPMRMFSTLAFSTFVLGLAISSYIFLNPIFERTMTLEEAVLVTAILTFFVPVLVIPWLITRDTGAKIKSQAKDYYLWKGMKRRLFEGAFAFMMFLSLFAISMYLGYDVVKASYTYAGYIVITAYVSFLYAFVYANYYHKGFRKGIIENFNDSKRQDR